MKILGLREMSGTSKKTGKPYSSVILYVGQELEGVYGVQTEEVWVPRDLWDELIQEAPGSGFVGLDCYTSYDRRGYLQDLSIK